MYNVYQYFSLYKHQQADADIVQYKFIQMKTNTMWVTLNSQNAEFYDTTILIQKVVRIRIENYNRMSVELT